MTKIRIPPLPTVNDILRMYNIRAKKHLSQNFIMDPRLLNRIVKKCGDIENKHVIEIGPGPGGITRAILGRGAWKCTVIEKDPRFLDSLNYINYTSGNRLDIHMGDVLSFNMENLFPEHLRRPWEEEAELTIIGNLPFSVSTILLIKWMRAVSERSNVFSYGRVPMYLTFQHEVAQRIIAPPNDVERSRLSVVCQNWARCEYEFMIPSGAFVPEPKVQVGYMSIKPLVKPYIDLPFPLVNKVVTTIFRGKRKNIRNTACNLFPKKLEYALGDKMLDLASVDPMRMAVSLTMEEFNKLCHAYKHIIDNNPTLADYRRNVTEDLEEDLKFSPADQQQKELAAGSQS